MYDRPTAQELIDAAIMHFESAIIPAVRSDRKLYFTTLVATNVLKIVGREMQHSRAHLLAEWERLNALQGGDQPLPVEPQAAQKALAERNSALCADIRAGKYDAAGEQQAALFAHLMATTVEQLVVANPKFLQTLAAEDAAEAG